jgi:hypothetical protein
LLQKIKVQKETNLRGEREKNKALNQSLGRRSEFNKASFEKLVDKSDVNPLHRFICRKEKGGKFKEEKGGGG